MGYGTFSEKINHALFRKDISGFRVGEKIILKIGILDI